MPPRTREVEVTVHATARAAPAMTFDVIVPIDLALIFDRFGPIPGVRGTRDQTGAWDHAGASRTVLLDDGSEAGEVLTEISRPHHFAYRVGPFTGPLRLLATHADGAWWFTPTGGGTATQLRWTYAFAPRRGMRPVLLLVLAPPWRAYAKRALARGVAEVHRVAAAAP